MARLSFFLRRADFQYDDHAARAQHTQSFAEGCLDIRNMPQGVTHGDDIEARTPQRQGFGGGLDQRNAEFCMGDREHGLADINAYDGAAIVGDGDHLAGQQAGADGDVEHRHAGTQVPPAQAGAARYQAPEPSENSRFAAS